MARRFAFRVGSILGIPVRVHLLFVAFVVIVTFSTPGYAAPETALSLLSLFAVLFFSVLLHELGHCLMARRHRGDAHDIEIGLLGGVSHLDHPKFPSVQAAVSLAGVGVNFLLALLAGAVFLLQDGSLPGLRGIGVGRFADAEGWSFGRDLLHQAWNLNLVLGLFNLLPGYPLDGGRAVECLFWRRFGRPRARLVVLASGALIGLGLLLWGFSQGAAILPMIGFWILWECGRDYQELRQRGLEEEALLGVYDFSEGQTSLDASAPPPDRSVRKREREEARRQRARRKREEAEQAAREAARDRVDALLDRIATEGMNSLSPEERAFLVEESRRLKASRPRS